MRAVIAPLGADPSGRALDALTPRELEVLALMSEGWSNAAIGGHLFLSERTVETHIGGIFAKLGIEDSPDGNRRVRAILAYLQAPAR
ncbi:Transcriptional regulatory protein LiaR [Microbacterium azadirachtae]|uniref:Transcriptional regulatory protein LiaR n=1 Tax=Microbacterium azadirachtae TaxID=582680 RepID=A0A0F0LH66_9MICO|nr:Transcriptional regulatory protein LiaR [Microbacterium azadirachtae]